MDPNEIIKNSFNRTTIETDDKKLKFISDPFTDACHYTFTTMSTVGYGDITPKSTAAKYWTMFMHIIAIFISLRLFDYYISDNSSNKALIEQMSQLEKSKKEYEDKNKILEDKNKILEDKNIEIKNIEIKLEKHINDEYTHKYIQDLILFGPNNQNDISLVQFIKNIFNMVCKIDNMDNMDNINKMDIELPCIGCSKEVINNI